MLREIEFLRCCGWDKAAAYLPAVNIVAVRIAALREELAAELGRLQGVYRRKIDRMLEKTEDT